MEENYYIRADLAIKNYQAHKANGAEELLALFKGFLDKFSSLIINGKPDLSNRCIRGFIKQFVNKSCKHRLHQAKYSQAIMENIEKTAKLIQEIFLRRYEPDEINNIIVMTFFHCANRYKPIDDNPRFHSYLLSCYHFRLYENLTRGVIDDLLNIALLEQNYVPLNSIKERYWCEDTYHLKKDTLLTTEQDSVIDDNWALGYTADIFENCNLFERNLLIMKYINKQSDAEISEMIGTSAKYVNNRKLDLIRRLREELLKKRLLKE